MSVDLLDIARAISCRSRAPRSLAATPTSMSQPYHEGHWIVYATRSDARRVRESLVDLGAPPDYKPTRFTVAGVEAELYSGPGTGAGAASRGHAIVYWVHSGVGYVASVHGYRNRGIARGIASGLIEQMVECVKQRDCPGVFA